MTYSPSSKNWRSKWKTTTQPAHTKCGSPADVPEEIVKKQTKKGPLEEQFRYNRGVDALQRLGKYMYYIRSTFTARNRLFDKGTARIDFALDSLIQYIFEVEGITTQQ